MERTRLRKVLRNEVVRGLTVRVSVMAAWVIPWGRLGAVWTEAMAAAGINDCDCRSCGSSQQAEVLRRGARE